MLPFLLLPFDSKYFLQWHLLHPFRFGCHVDDDFVIFAWISCSTLYLLGGILNIFHAIRNVHFFYRS